MNRRSLGALLTLVWVTLLFVLTAFTRNPISEYFLRQAFWLHSSWGSRFYASGNYDLAAREYTKMVSFRPDLMDGYAMRGKALARLGRYQAADDDDTAALARVVATERARGATAEETNEATAMLYMERGRARSGAGAYDQAVADLTRAIHLWPEVPDARSLRMEASFRARQFDAASADADYLIAHRDFMDLGAAYTLRGKVAARHGHYGQAAALAQACHTAPGVADNWFDLGWYSFKSGQAAQSIAAYREALVRDPDRVSGMFRLCLAYLAAGYPDNAMDTINTALPKSTKADRAAARQDLAEAYGDYPSAADNLDRCAGWLRDSPSNPF